MQGNYTVDLVLGETEYVYRDDSNLAVRHINCWFKNNGYGLNRITSTYHEILLLGVF